MEGEGAALVLDKEAGNFAEALARVGEGLPERRVPGGVAGRQASVEAMLGPVQARSVEAVGRQEAVDRRDRSSADDGERAVEGGREAREHAAQGGVDGHRLGPGSDLDQGAVEVEEQGRRPRADGGGLALGPGQDGGHARSRIDARRRARRPRATSPFGGRLGWRRSGPSARENAGPWDRPRSTRETASLFHGRERCRGDMGACEGERRNSMTGKRGAILSSSPRRARIDGRKR